jgi:predicted nucleic-acid-binding protein
MIGLDTNVLIRYLTQDDAVQARKANEIIAEHTDAGARCHVDPTVLCELAWVLRESYGRGKADILKTLDLMLATKQFEIGDKDLVREAIEGFRQGRGDFADYIIGIRHSQAGCDATVTFDRGLKDSPLFKVV